MPDTIPPKDADILDLDNVVIPSKYIKIGKDYFEVNPATVLDFVKVAKLERKLLNIESEDDVIPTIKEALGSLVPAIAEDQIQFTIPQLKEIIKFVMKVSVPPLENPAEKRQYDDPKKKVVSPEELPTSATSTPPTPS